MENVNFISIDKNSLKVHSYLLTNDQGKTIQLVPIVHLGERNYYKELMDFIWEKICLYEYIQLASIENAVPYSNLDEMVNFYETDSGEFYNTYKKYIKKLRRKAFTKVIRKKSKDNNKFLTWFTSYNN